MSILRIKKTIERERESRCNRQKMSCSNQMAAGEPQIKEGRCNISLQTRAYYHIPIHDYVISTTSIYTTNMWQISPALSPRSTAFSIFFPPHIGWFWGLPFQQKNTAGHLGNNPKSLHQRAHLLKGRGNRIEDLVTNEGFWGRTINMLFLLDRIGS